MNKNHYPKGSSKGGQFAPKDSSSVSSSEKQTFEPSINYVPKTNLDGSPRVFFSDLSKEEQDAIEKSYNEQHFEVLSYSDYLYDNFNTSKINTDERNMLRQKWVNDEIEEQFQNGDKKQERRATIVIGMPGSGKSSIGNPLAEEMGAFIIDADNFKQRIPEFKKDVRMAGAVHHESVKMSDSMRKELAEDGYNLVIGKVGGDYKSVKYILDELEEYGYNIDVILCDVPIGIAYNRAIGRYDRGETNRLVPFWTMKTADKNIFGTFDEMLNHPAAIGGRLFSNDVPKGEQPKLLKRYDK